MLCVVYTECYLCCVAKQALILSVIMLNVVMACVYYADCYLCCVSKYTLMLRIIMLNVVMLSAHLLPSRLELTQASSRSAT